MSADLINVIFGMKLRQARTEAGLTLSELASQAEMSPSYLTEIEKGRKYPRTDKIMKMAEVLEKRYDDLVSIQLDPSLTHLESALRSPLLQRFPFDEFGLELGDLVNLLTRSPDQMSALLHALGEIGRLYDMKEEHLLRAILRSYQELNENYFPELEDAAVEMATEYGLNGDLPLPLPRLEDILRKRHGYELEYGLQAQDPRLNHYRAVLKNGQSRRLIFNEDLMPRQVRFLIAREMAHEFLSHRERSVTSPPDRVDSFQQVLNDFRASYMAGTLLMPRQMVLDDLQELFDQSKWQPQRLLEMLDRYEVTPEMLMYRFSELIPQFFGLNLHFLRMQKGRDGQYRLVKQLNMNRLRLPSGWGRNEHHCRRWLTVRMLKELNADGATPVSPHVGAQLSEFLHSRDRYLCLGLARPLVLRAGATSSVIVGFRIGTDFSRTVRFADDPAIPRQIIHDTCERCPLSLEQCAERAVPPTIWQAEQAEAARKEAVQLLMDR